MKVKVFFVAKRAVDQVVANSKHSQFQLAEASVIKSCPHIAQAMRKSLVRNLRSTSYSVGTHMPTESKEAKLLDNVHHVELVVD